MGAVLTDFDALLLTIGDFARVGIHAEKLSTFAEEADVGEVAARVLGVTFDVQANGDVNDRSVRLDVSKVVHAELDDAEDGANDTQNLDYAESSHGWWR